jgi:hypothetical protein
MIGDRTFGNSPGNLHRIGTSSYMARDVNALHNQTEFLCQGARIGSTGVGCDLFDQRFHALFAAGGSLICRIVREREFDGGVHKDTALEIVVGGDEIDDIEQRHQLAGAGIAAALSNHFGKRLSYPLIFVVQGGKHQVFLALEMLVERGFANTESARI